MNIVSSGKTTYNVVLNDDQFVYGTTYRSILNKYAGNVSQVVESGGKTYSTSITANGNHQIINNGGIAYSTTINGTGKIYIPTQTINYGGINSAATLTNDVYQYINAGASDYNTTLINAKQIVSAGGYTYNTINNAASQTIEQNGVAKGAKINTGGIMEVRGSAINITVNSDGILYINGGILSGTTVNKNGKLKLSNTASAINITIKESGGIYSPNFNDLYFIVNSGGKIQKATYNNGKLNIISGTKAYKFTISSGGSAEVKDGGMTTSVSIISYGALTLSSGGTTVNTILYENGKQIVSTGGSASKTNIKSGGEELVKNGGITINTLISNGGKQTVSVGGITSKTKISNGGYQYISSGGYTKSTIINAGGNQVVLSNGSALSTTINKNGIQYISNGGIAVKTLVKDGATIELAGHNASAMYITVNPGGNIAINDYATPEVYCKVKKNGLLKNVNAIYENIYLNVYSKSVASNFIITGGRYGVLNQRVFKNASTTNAIISASSYENSLQTVFNGGVTFKTIVYRGTQIISSGGKASNTIISAADSSAFQTIDSAGTAYSTAIKSGGTQVITSDGKSINAVIQSSGIQKVSNGGRALNTTIKNGTQIIETGGIVSGVTAVAGIISAGKDNTLSNITLKNNSIVNFTSSVTLKGSAFVIKSELNGYSYDASNNKIILAKSTKLTLGTKANLSTDVLDASKNATINIIGYGAKINSLKLGNNTSIIYDISSIDSSTTSKMLTITSANKQKKGIYSISVAKSQSIGSYILSNKITINKDTDYTVKLNNNKLGTINILFHMAPNFCQNVSEKISQNNIHSQMLIFHLYIYYQEYFFYFSIF